MKAMAEVFQFSKGQVVHTTIVGEQINNEMCPVIPLGMEVYILRSNIKIEVADFKTRYRDYQAKPGEFGCWGSATGDGSPKLDFDLYPGATLDIISSRNLIVRVSHAQKSFIDRDKILRLG